MDVKENTLSVSKPAGRINGEIKVTQPKTKNSVRTIYLPKETVDLLVEGHRKHIFDQCMFLLSVTGEMYTPECVRRPHKKLLERAEIAEKVRFHNLRRIFATLTIQDRVDGKTVFQHPGPLLRGLYPGHLHPCDRGYAEGGGQAGGKHYYAIGIK